MSLFCGTWNKVCMPCWSSEKQNDSTDPLLTVLKGKGDNTTNIHSTVPLQSSPDPLPSVMQAKEKNISSVPLTPSPADLVPTVAEGKGGCVYETGPQPSKATSTKIHSQEISVSVAGNNNIVHAGIGAADRVLETLDKYCEHNAKLRSPNRPAPPISYQGTRTDLLLRVMAWINNSILEEMQDETDEEMYDRTDDGTDDRTAKRISKKKLFWLSGPAGVGKSAFAQSLGEMCVKNKVFGGGFFFSGQNNLNLPLTVFPTIAYELCTNNATYKMKVAHILRNNPSIVQANLRFQFQNLIVDPLASVTLPDKRLVIIIDGLDECANKSAQREITQLICGVLNDPKIPVLWVVCSRTSQSLSQTLESQSKYVLRRCWRHEFDISSEESKEEVARFIDESYKLLRSAHPLPLEKWPGKETMDILCEASSGLFAFPATLFRYIENREHPDVYLNDALRVLAMHKRKGVTQDVDVSWAANLDALYTRILDDREQLSDKLLQDSLWVLHTLAITKGGDHLLHSDNVQEFCNSVGLGKGTFYSCLEGLHSVLKIPDPKVAPRNKLSFLHASFPDFLYDCRRSHKYSIDDIQIKDKIFVRVLEILKSDIPLASLGIAVDKFKNANESEDVDEGRNVDESKDVDKSKEQLYPLIRSCLPWPDPDDKRDKRSCLKLAVGVTKSAIRTFFLLLTDNLERQQNFNFNLFAYLNCGWRLPISILLKVGRTMDIYDSVDRRLSRLRKEYFPRAVPMSANWLQNTKAKPSYIFLGHNKNSVLVIVIPANVKYVRTSDEIGVIACQEPHEIWPHVIGKTTEEYSDKINVLWKANLEA